MSSLMDDFSFHRLRLCNFTSHLKEEKVNYQAKRENSISFIYLSSESFLFLMKSSRNLSLNARKLYPPNSLTNSSSTLIKNLLFKQKPASWRVIESRPISENPLMETETKLETERSQSISHKSAITRVVRL